MIPKTIKANEDNDLKYRISDPTEDRGRGNTKLVQCNSKCSECMNHCSNHKTYNGSSELQYFTE